MENSVTNSVAPQGSENRDSRTPSGAHLVTTTDLYAASNRPIVVEETPGNWAAVVEAFLNSAVDSPGTRRAYARHLRNAGQLWGEVDVADLTGVSLSEYRASILASGLALSTQSQALSAVRSFLTWAGNMGAHRLRAEVIAAALRVPRGSATQRYSIVNEREIGAMLASAPSTRERAILGVLLGAGLRVAECAQLHVSDIVEELDGGVSLFVRSGKGRKDRMVPIGEEVDRLLRDYLVETRRVLGMEAFLFLADDRGAASRTGSGLSTRSISRLVAMIAQSDPLRAIDFR